MLIFFKIIDIDKYFIDYFYDGIKKIYVFLNFGVFKIKYCCKCLIINQLSVGMVFNMICKNFLLD